MAYFRKTSHFATRKLYRNLIDKISEFKKGLISDSRIKVGFFEVDNDVSILVCSFSFTFVRKLNSFFSMSLGSDLAINAMGDLVVSAGDFLSGFGTSFAMILATEIGDRTFFIAAIMAMKHDRIVVWSGALTALAVMTVLSAIFGLAAVTFFPPWLVNWAVVFLMLYFGISMMKEGLQMNPNVAGFEEMEEVKEEMGEIDDKTLAYMEDNDKKERKKPNRSVFLEACTLTFLAEWGDRSQMATIALAAVYNATGVILGANVGHALCTGFAVVGGRLIADYVSERFVHIAGGALFIAFAGIGAMVEILRTLLII